MKKSLISFILLSVSCTAMADKGGFEPGETPPPAKEHDSGYKGTEDTNETLIKHLSELRQGHWVTLEGYLLEKKSNDTYVFRDKSGKMLVKIPQGAWRERTFDSKDMIRLSGKVVKDGGKPSLNVERVDEP